MSKKREGGNAGGYEGFHLHTGFSGGDGFSSDRDAIFAQRHGDINERERQGVHIGMRSEVRLAAMIPAMRATSSGSPLGLCGSACRTSGLMRTKALASASRLVAALPETSTMRARPESS